MKNYENNKIKYRNLSKIMLTACHHYLYLLHCGIKYTKMIGSLHEHISDIVLPRRLYI